MLTLEVAHVGRGARRASSSIRRAPPHLRLQIERVLPPFTALSQVLGGCQALPPSLGRGDGAPRTP